MKITRPGTKGDETRRRIISAAMKCLAKFGDRQLSFQKIADECGISQPLVVHYFGRRENIFPTVLEHMLERARALTAEQVSAAQTPADKLSAYLQVSLEIFRSEPEIGPIYLTLYYLAGFDKKFKRLNTEIKNIAVGRLVEIIEAGVKEGVFETANPGLSAKTIHNALIGFLISAVTEESSFSDAQLLEELRLMSFKILTYRPKVPIQADA